VRLWFVPARHGLLAAVLALLPWAYVGDRLGRRPAVLMGVSGACCVALLFGFSTSYAAMFVLRALLGTFCAAQGALTRVMGVEMSSSETRSQAIIYVSLGFQVGGTLAPVFGSTFSKPAERWPGLFKGGLFERHPYALPQLAAVLVPGLAAAIGFFKLKETQRSGGRKASAEGFGAMFTPKFRYAMW
jgi:MFS family permease